MCIPERYLPFIVLVKLLYRIGLLFLRLVRLYKKVNVILQYILHNNGLLLVIKYHSNSFQRSLSTYHSQT